MINANHHSNPLLISFWRYGLHFISVTVGSKQDSRSCTYISNFTEREQCSRKGFNSSGFAASQRCPPRDAPPKPARAAPRGLQTMLQPGELGPQPPAITSPKPCTLHIGSAWSKVMPLSARLYRGQGSASAQWSHWVQEGTSSDGGHGPCFLLISSALVPTKWRASMEIPTETCCGSDTADVRWDIFKLTTAQAVF